MLKWLARSPSESQALVRSPRTRSSSHRMRICIVAWNHAGQNFNQQGIREDVHILRPHLIVFCSTECGGLIIPPHANRRVSSLR